MNEDKTELDNAKQTMIWVCSEINIVVRQIENSNWYDKTRHKGYLSALKKVKQRLEGHKNG